MKNTTKRITQLPGFTWRRATYQDLQAVLDIREDIYNGADYMKAMFFYFLQSSRHAVYVVEHCEKVIGLVNFHFHPEKDITTVMSARVHPSFEGQKYFRGRAGLMTQILNKDHPEIHNYVTYSISKPSGRIYRDGTIHQWIMLHYGSSVEHLQSRLTICSSLLNPPQLRQPVEISYAQSTQMLNGKVGYEIERLLSSYATGYVPFMNSWTPVKINQTGIRDIFQFSNKVLASYARVSDGDSLRGALPISQQPQRQHQNQGEGKKLEENNLTLTAFSYAACMQHGNQPRYDGVLAVFFYGNQKHEFLQHIYSHLCHLANIFRGSIALHLHYPTVIDDEELRDRLSQAFNIGQYLRHEAYGYISKL